MILEPIHVETTILTFISLAQYLIESNISNTHCVAITSENVATYVKFNYEDTSITVASFRASASYDGYAFDTNNYLIIKANTVIHILGGKYALAAAKCIVDGGRITPSVLIKSPFSFVKAVLYSLSNPSIIPDSSPDKQVEQTILMFTKHDFASGLVRTCGFSPRDTAKLLGIFRGKEPQ